MPDGRGQSAARSEHHALMPRWCEERDVIAFVDRIDKLRACNTSCNAVIDGPGTGAEAATLAGAVAAAKAGESPARGGRASPVHSSKVIVAPRAPPRFRAPLLGEAWDYLLARWSMDALTCRGWWLPACA